MTLLQKEQKLIEELNDIDEWIFQYEYILMKSMSLKHFAENLRTDSNLIRGCQAKVWILVEIEDGIVHVSGDSMSLIVKGLLALLIEIIDGSSVNELLSYNISFLNKTGLGKELSTDRLNGINAMHKYIKNKIMEVYYGN